MNARQTVKAQYPEACRRTENGRHVVLTDYGPGAKALAYGDTESRAWTAAAKAVGQPGAPERGRIATTTETKP